MTKLNDLELVLLANAAKRDNGSLLPAPTSVAQSGDRLTAAINNLLTLSLVSESSTKTAEITWRTDDDVRLGLFVNEAGRAAVHVLPESTNVADLPRAEPAAPEAKKLERSTISAVVLKMLEGPSGATLPEIIAATGWLPHTTRAALTGLRKKGFSIARGKRDDETCYSIAAER